MLEKIKSFFRASWVAIIVFGGVLIGVVIAIARACIPKKAAPPKSDPVADAQERDKYADLQRKIVASHIELDKAITERERAQKERDAAQRAERDKRLAQEAENQSSRALKESLLKEAEDALKK